MLSVNVTCQPNYIQRNLLLVINQSFILLQIYKKFCLKYQVEVQNLGDIYNTVAETGF